MTISHNIAALPEIDSTISCSYCAGLGALCCRSVTVMPLSKKEVTWLKIEGTELRLFPKGEIPKSIGRSGFGRQFFQFVGDCASLQNDGSCGNYEHRTKACQEFVVGGFLCQQLNILHETVTDSADRTV